MKTFCFQYGFIFILLLMGINISQLHGQKINYLKISILTGNDDLRGGNDNAYFTALVSCDYFNPKGDCNFLIPISQRINLNQKQRWKDRSRHERTVYLKEAIPPSALKAVKIETTFRGGISGDNWNIDAISIEGFGPNNYGVVLYDKRGKPWRRLTGDRREVTIRF